MRVSLPHSSASDRSQGAAVDGLENAQPGDLICYSGHVALYIGNGQIVHASNKKTGIIVSRADYRKILAIRRICQEESSKTERKDKNKYEMIQKRNQFTGRRNRFLFCYSNYTSFQNIVCVEKLSGNNWMYKIDKRK